MFRKINSSETKFLPETWFLLCDRVEANVFFKEKTLASTKVFLQKTLASIIIYLKNYMRGNKLSGKSFALRNFCLKNFINEARNQIFSKNVSKKFNL
jgi:hypothetical protein